MSVPHSSQIYFGGTVAYNKKHSGKLLFRDEVLHALLLSVFSFLVQLLMLVATLSNTPNWKMNWGAKKMEINWVKNMVDSRNGISILPSHENGICHSRGWGDGSYVSHPKGINAGFAILAVAGQWHCQHGALEQHKQQSSNRGNSVAGDGGIKILEQKVVHSTHADRELNMQLFADAAADLCLSVAESSMEKEKIV